MTALPPAPLWRRYTAWSLDFTLLGGLATVLSWPRLQSGWADATFGMHRLSGLVGPALVDGLMKGATPELLSQRLLADPQVRSAAAMVEAGLDRMALSWLLVYAGFAALYHIGFECTPWRGSLGKHALQLRVAGYGTHGVSPARLVVRHFAGALSWLTLNLGHAMALVTRDKRALHDVIAGLRLESEAGTQRLPAWARLWLALQVFAALALAAWCVRRYVIALQAALG